ncbi:MAG: hypothetical protein HYY24_08145 [Verrucomicrobia bacterium]|nr:hypothetical protein [Verrucomicrobiota bacterium]
MILSSMILSFPADRVGPSQAADKIIADKIILLLLVSLRSERSSSPALALAGKNSIANACPIGEDAHA